MTGRRINGSERFTICPAAGAALPRAGVSTPHLAARHHADLPVDDDLFTGLNPCSMTTRSPCRCPSFTGLSSAVESCLTTYTNGPFAESCGAAAGTSTASGRVASIRRTFTNCPGHRSVVRVRNGGAQHHCSAAALHGVIEECELSDDRFVRLIRQSHLNLQRSLGRDRAARREDRFRSP